MVGALADWFAVTALFRHPLGIPIPHTAIIPRRKDQIGRSLGEFVEGNFLTHDVLGERLADAGVGRRLGAWLATPTTPRRAADGLADAFRGTLEVLDDSEVQAGLERIVERASVPTPAAPVLGRAIDLAVDGGHHQRLLDAVLVGLGGFLEDNRITFRERLETESPWWIPESIDDRIFEKIYTAVHRFIGDVGADPDHEVRHTIDARVERVRRPPPKRSGTTRQGRRAEGRVARPPRRQGLAGVALGRDEAGDDRRSSRREQRAPRSHDAGPPAPRRAIDGRRRSCSARSTTG